MKLFSLRIAFLLLCCATLVRSESPRSSVLVVYDSGDAYALPCFKQIIVTLEYNRLPYVTYDLARSTSLPDLDSYISVITATEMLWKIDPPSCDLLNSYVSNGGGLAVLYRGWNANIHTLLGVTATQSPVVSERKSRGLNFIRELIPGINPTSIAPSILGDISAYDIRLTPTASAFATSAVDQLPVGWINSYGKGKVVFWNTVLLSEKIYRGLIIPSLGAVQPVTISPIINLSVICLDDFPNASPNAKVEPIKSEFNMTVSEFYAFQWYPDMLRLARQYGLRYTSGLVFGYGEVTTPPYKFSEWVNSTVERGGKKINSSVWLARKAQKDIEIAFHGQNHQPLTLKNWRSRDNMKLALSAARKRWEYDNLGPDPLSYIPPMNVIDSVGMNALTDIFPAIRVIGSQYMGRFAMGQNREFGTDPWNPRIKSFPRVTSGFIFDDFNKLLTLSLIHTVGAWTHFVHPDDILPVAGRYAENTRDDLASENWQWLGEPNHTGIFYSFESWIRFVNKYYPWLRYDDYAHAYAPLSNYEACQVSVRSVERKVNVRLNIVPSDFTIHVNDGNTIVSCNGGEILQTNVLAFSSYYVIRARKSDIAITLRDPVAPLFYQAGSPAHLYLAGDSRYSGSTTEQKQYPAGLASLQPYRSVRGRIRQTASAQNAAALAATFRSSGRRSGGAGERSTSDVSEKSQAEQDAPLPQDPLSRARRFVELDQKEKAIPVYETYLSTHLNDAKTWRDLYQLYTWSDRPKDATRALEAYVRLSPDDYQSMQTLAEAYVGAERQKEAIPLYERLAAHAPDGLATRTMLAQLYGWNGMSDQAGREYERLYEGASHDTAYAMRAAEQYQAAGRTADASRMIEEVVRRNPSDLQSMKKLGEMYLWQERQPDAIRVYERIVQAEPDSLPSRITLARLYGWNKRPEEATMQSREILKRDAGNIDALRIVADNARAEENWFDARAWYSIVAQHRPHDTDVREYLDAVRRDHGLHFTSAYEWIDDSNNLTREELPVSIELYQTRLADYYLRAVGRRVRDNRLIPVINPDGTDEGMTTRAGLSKTGYGAGLGAKFALGRRTAFSFEALATRYDSNWTPITMGAKLEHSFTDRFSGSISLERSETVEGIQAIRRNMYTTSARGELFLQATDRWSIGTMAEFESYTDNNLRSTGAILSTYKIVLRQPQIALQASSIYQDTKLIYLTSEPYWTPRELFTNSIGASLSYTFFDVFTPEISETGTVQGGVFSNNVGAKVVIQLSQFLQLTAEYGKLGSSVYRQTVARAGLSYRY
ncbi:MAG TPA: DUF2194 domain-containing protein [Bacteroidota bacterium]|nr:DUF2194 domain-containing protein [Bacteroidota bacterium]